MKTSGITAFYKYCLAWVFLSSGLITAQTQLSHWPLFRPDTTDIEIDFTKTPPASTFSYPLTLDKNDDTLIQYRAMNAFHDNNGDLVLYVVCDDVDTYIYNSQGKKLIEVGRFKNHLAGISSSEIGIVPIPNSCFRGFHVLVGGQIFVADLNSDTIYYGYNSPWRYSRGVKLNSTTHTDTFDYPLAITNLTTEGYTVYSVEANFTGATGRYVTKAEVGFCQVGGLYKSPSINKGIFRDITSTSAPASFIHLTGFHEYISEIEVAPDGSHLAFSDNSRIYILGIDAAGNHSSYEVADTFPNNALNEYRIGGLEFSQNNELVYSYFDRNMGSSIGGVGVWDFLNSPNGNLISGTSDYGRSQIELGRDGKIYVTGPNALDVVDISSSSIVSTSILTAALTLNEPVMNRSGFDNSIRTLPDQIDGHDYVNFINNLNYQYQGTDIYPIQVCYGQKVNLIASSITGCYGGNVSISWSPSLDSSNNRTSYPLYSDTYFTASYENDFGCIVEEVFFVDVSDPPYGTLEIIDVCEGNDATIAVQCNDSSFEWLAPAYLVGTNTQFVIALDVQQNEDYIYRCLDANGCELYTHTVHLNVIDVPELASAYVPICEGQTVNLNDYQPTGFNCSWVNDSGQVVSNPLVSPSQSTSYIATCINSQGCEVVGAQVYVDVVQQAIVLPYLTIDACEGDVVDLSLFSIPGTLSEIIINGNTEIQRYAAYDDNICLTYYDVTINYLPKLTHVIDIDMGCGQEINLDNYGSNCSGYNLDWTIPANGITITSPLYVITESVTLEGEGFVVGLGCCEVILNVNVPAHDVLEADVCVAGDPLPFACINSPNAEWFKDGQPYTGSISTPGEYRILCKDAYGCILKEYVLNAVNDESVPCYQQWHCLVTDLNIPNPCPLGSTVLWEKDGQPFSMQPDFSINPNGVGTYDALCVDALGDTFKYRFEVYDCQKFFKRGNSTIEEGNPEERAVDLSVYPNPSKGLFTVQWDELSSEQAATLYIHDYSGRLIKQQSVESGQTETLIDLSDYAKGVYVLTYKTSTNTINRKITLY